MCESTYGEENDTFFDATFEGRLKEGLAFYCDVDSGGQRTMAAH